MCPLSPLSHGPLLVLEVILCTLITYCSSICGNCSLQPVNAFDITVQCINNSNVQVGWKNLTPINLITVEYSCYDTSSGVDRKVIQECIHPGCSSRALKGGPVIVTDLPINETTYCTFGGCVLEISSEQCFRLNTDRETCFHKGTNSIEIVQTSSLSAGMHFPASQTDNVVSYSSSLQPLITSSTSSSLQPLITSSSHVPVETPTELSTNLPNIYYVVIASTAVLLILSASTMIVSIMCIYFVKGSHTSSSPNEIQSGFGVLQKIEISLLFADSYPAESLETIIEDLEDNFNESPVTDNDGVHKTESIIIIDRQMVPVTGTDRNSNINTKTKEDTSTYIIKKSKIALNQYCSNPNTGY